MMFAGAIAAVALASVGTAVVFSGKISLSVGVGGVIGLANLALWWRVVGALVLLRQGGRLSPGGIALRLVYKLVPLVVLLAVLFRSPLHPIGVLGGFGAALLGMLGGALFSPASAHSDGVKHVAHQ